MPRKGLTKELIVDAAVRLIEERGNQAFSLNELARHLEIKPASLYNHIQNIAELNDEIESRIARMLRRAELAAIQDKSGDSAIYALCNAYRTFANEHMELYKVNIGRQVVKNDFEKVEKGEIIDPIFKVLADFQLTEDVQMHWHRILRATLHGFITQEFASRFRGFPVDHDKTYQMAVETIILGIHNTERNIENE